MIYLKIYLVGIIIYLLISYRVSEDKREDLEHIHPVILLIIIFMCVLIWPVILFKTIFGEKK
jgi:4-amino-4-deoxy-L-arabinose transferase-like glycosyltransferase